MATVTALRKSLLERQNLNAVALPYQGVFGACGRGARRADAAVPQLRARRSGA
ncbi:MAG: hypothetical protein JO021_23290 [Alphaproteobacteria bacterium]|nr:hypothetical protein [Alphaproteobacteria bacterium]